MRDVKTTGAVTADDVARLAGVSRWTVNRAFKKDASISAKSRDKVMAAAEQLGYVPDLLAGSLGSDRSGLVALLVDDLRNPQQLTMISHLTSTLRTEGWFTLLVSTRDADDASAALLHASQHRVDAAVVIGGYFDDVALMEALGAQRMRRLITYGRVSHNPNTVSISCDDHAAMTDVTRHVLERGYRKPLFVAGPQNVSVHLMRKETMLEVWQKARGETPEVLAADTFNPDKAHACVLRHFQTRAPDTYPDVLVCENDAIAMGAMDALRHDLGLRVPQDVAVTGFDDSAFAGNRNYDLTTYRQPNAEMAQAVVSLLQGKPASPQLARLRGELVLRSSA